jgi:hypothetical protein
MEFCHACRVCQVRVWHIESLTTAAAGRCACRMAWLVSKNVSYLVSLWCKCALYIKLNNMEGVDWTRDLNEQNDVGQ